MGSDARGGGRRRRICDISVALLVLAFIFATSLHFMGADQREENREGFVPDVGGGDDTGVETTAGGGINGEDTAGDDIYVDAIDASSSVAHNGKFVSSGECPLSIPGGSAKSFRSNGSGQAWSYVSEEDLEYLASSLLVELRDEGWSLVRSEKLDLYGEAWGCVAQKKEGSRVILIHISPRILEISQSQENELSISIVELSHAG